MTFDEALAKKQSIGENRVSNKLSQRVFVGPTNPNELGFLLAHYKKHPNKTSDQTCKQFCTNNEFSVYGLWTDRVSVLYEFIE